MQICIQYGQTELDLYSEESVEVLAPKKVKVPDAQETIQGALSLPRGGISFQEFLDQAQPLLIVVNDATRPTPTAKILKEIYPFLSSHPELYFLIATGTHREPTEEEYRYIFGSFYETFRDNILVHDCQSSPTTYLGSTKYGTEVHLNSLVLQIKNILVIGSVEPHYFAGYTGGRKSLIPGVAAFKSIEMNHSLAMQDQARPCALQGNPVHEDLQEALNFQQDLNIFSIQAVLTAEHEIYAVTAGDLQSSFERAVCACDQIYCVALKQKANIVLSVAPYPLDIDLYQAQKAIEHARLAAEEKSIIILVSQCRMGVGNDTFLRLLRMASDAQQILDSLSSNYKLGYHKAVKMAQTTLQHRLWAVTDLQGEIIKQTFMTPYPRVQQALDEASALLKSENRKPHIAVLPAGSLTIPVFGF